MQEGLAENWHYGTGDGNEELWTAWAGFLTPLLCMGFKCDAAEGNSVRDGVGVFFLVLVVKWDFFLVVVVVLLLLLFALKKYIFGL